VEDLKGKPVAFASRSSTSGYLIPLVDLQKRGLIENSRGLEDFFGVGNVWYGTGYVSAVERVLTGEAEAAAVSYYVLDKDKHLSAEQRASLRMLQKQGPVPTHVLAVSSRLTEADRKVLLKAALALNEPADTELRDRVFTSKLVEVDESVHLEPAVQALEVVGLRAAKP